MAGQRDIDRRCIRAGFGSPARAPERVVALGALEGIGKARRQCHTVGGESSLAGPRLAGQDGTSAGRAGPPAIRTRLQPGGSMGAVAVRRGSRSATGRSRSISAPVWPVVVETRRVVVVGGRWYRPDLVRSDLLVIPPLCGHHIGASAP